MRNDGPRVAYTESRTILAVRQDYDAGVPLAQIVARHGVSDNTIRRWRERFCWPMRQVQPTGKMAHKRKAGVIQASNDAMVRRWRCECLPGGRLNTEATCGSCGHIPPWAEKGAAG